MSGPAAVATWNLEVVAAMGLEVARYPEAEAGLVGSSGSGIGVWLPTNVHHQQDQRELNSMVGSASKV